MLSLHILGMFALSPVNGRLADRFGQLPVILAGLVVLEAAAALVVLVHAFGTAGLAVALFLVGYGWNLCFVGGSGLLTRNLTAPERTRGEAAVDALVGDVGGREPGVRRGLRRRRVRRPRRGERGTLAGGVRRRGRVARLTSRLAGFLDRGGTGRRRGANLAECTLVRRFHESTRTTPLKCLRAQRIDGARELLESTTLPVEQVGDACGLGSPADFRQHFNELVGVSPSEYRRTFRDAATA
ncbi:MAG: helix-turn-helix domain-containing protein [Streptosporangiales bacterium]|nr:helix-turn-helix domain-containing protein [Streptosporangiales bacterium]